MVDDLQEFLTDLTQEVAAAATATGALTRTVFVEKLVTARVFRSGEIASFFGSAVLIESIFVIRFEFRIKTSLEDVSTT